MDNDEIDYAALFPADPDKEARTEALDRILFDDDRQPFLLVDAAASPEVATYLQGFSDPARCLFDGAVFEDLSEVAPWLVQLSRHGDVFDWFVEAGFGNNWGVFVHSDLPMAKLKTRLKAHLYVYDEEGEKMFFKFYRPRALRDFVPVMADPQRAGFFRGIDAYIVEDGPGLRRMSADEEGRLVTQEIALTETEGAERP